MLLDTYDVQKYIAACAHKAGVKVVWDKDAVPSTDGATMWLPTLDTYAGDEQVCNLKQFVKHETSHVLYSDFSVLKETNPSKLLQTVWNLLEDHRVDYLNDAQYDGDRWNTDAFMVWHVERAREKTSKDKVSEDVAAILSPLFAWDAAIRNDLWNMHEAEEFYRSTCSESGFVALDKLEKGDYAKVLRNIREIEAPTEGTTATRDLAIRILKEVFDIPEESMTKKEKEGVEEGAGEGSGADDGDDKNGERKESLDEVDFSGATVQPYPEHGKEGGINAKNYTCGKGKYTPTPYNQMFVHDFDLGVTKNNCGRGTRVWAGGGKDIVALTSGDEGFANRIRTRLQVYSRDRWEYGKKKGKLHTSTLYRVGMKEAHGINERVFKKQIHNNTLDVCVQLLVDASGSMSYAKFEHAAAAACLLNHTLANTLHIPVEILAFTEFHPSAPHPSDLHAMFVMKGFDKKVNTHALADRFAATSTHLCDNVDGESLAWSFDRIKVRKEKRKLMVVLSDGSPCGGHGKGDTISHTHSVIKAIQNTPVEIIGVGIMYDAVRDFYKKWAYIPTASNIEQVLFELVDKNIIR